LRISPFPESVSCPNCRLVQQERSTRCRRCHHSLGTAFIEIYIPSPLLPLTPQVEYEIRKQVGGLIRRLRSRRELTQATLASLTGIHRTYLSRAERGQVMPSITALMQIAGALQVDKVLLRIRNLNH
jgi:DNA-binding XRE family transcriptional regulator